MKAWEIAADRKREDIVKRAIHPVWPDLIFDPTPRFFPTDYHLSLPYGHPYGGYIGDLEVKWFRHDSSVGGVFNYNKLLQIQSMTIFRDHTYAFHRIALRYTDGILLLPASELACIKPEWFVRNDTQERDLVVHVPIDRLKEKYWLPVETTDE